MRKEDGRLLRSFAAGAARHDGYLDDYAFLIAGLLDLYEATGQPRWLRDAIALDGILERFHEDRERGGFFLTSHDHEQLLAREKPSHDGAEPSGNSVHILSLLRLHTLTLDDGYRRRAELALGAFAPVLDRSPQALGEMLLALEYLAGSPKEIVIVVPTARAEAEPLLAAMRGTYVPHRVLAVVAQGAEQTALATLAPIVSDKTCQRGAATAYVCERGTCALPTSDPVVFTRQLQRLGRPARTAR